MIIGPTAVGKSALAIKLASSLDGEIISADSRQVYRGMDIGTAKPSQIDRSEIPHHLIDVVDPDEPYSLKLFMTQADVSIRNIRNRGKLPILVGGTGQYIWSLIEGWDVPKVPPDTKLRSCLEEQARSLGINRLYEQLAHLDPEAAERIDSRNLRRVVRALEVRLSSESHATPTTHTVPMIKDARIIGLRLNRQLLYGRVDTRVEKMIQSGWINETESLLDKGYSPNLPSMSGIGYRELVQYLEGDLSLEEAVQRTKYRTHRLVRNQCSWFRESDTRIHWLEANHDYDALYKSVLMTLPTP